MPRIRAHFGQGSAELPASVVNGDRNRDDLSHSDRFRELTPDTADPHRPSVAATLWARLVGAVDDRYEWPVPLASLQ